MTRPVRLLRVSTVATRLDCSVRTVWHLIALGKLTAVRIGRRSTRIEEAEVERFVTDARRQAT